MRAAGMDGQMLSIVDFHANQYFFLTPIRRQAFVSHAEDLLALVTQIPDRGSTFKEGPTGFEGVPGLLSRFRRNGWSQKFWCLLLDITRGCWLQLQGGRCYEQSGGQALLLGQCHQYCSRNPRQSMWKAHKLNFETNLESFTSLYLIDHINNKHFHLQRIKHAAFHHH